MTHQKRNYFLTAVVALTIVAMQPSHCAAPNNQLKPYQPTSLNVGNALTAAGRFGAAATLGSVLVASLTAHVHGAPSLHQYIRRYGSRSLAVCGIIWLAGTAIEHWKHNKSTQRRSH